MNNTLNIDFSTVKGKNIRKPTTPQNTRKKAPNGKVTERMTIDLIQSFYGVNCRVDRLPDSLDAGHYEDIRPCDLFVTFKRGILSKQCTICYVECKETGKEKKVLTFSVLNSGQRRAIRHTMNLEIPYFVVFQHLLSHSIYLVPATEILKLEAEGKKSMNEKQLEQFLWTNKGKLHDYFCS